MFIKFTPGPRDFKVGDVVVMVGTTSTATLGGPNFIDKITDTHYHVRMVGYKQPLRVPIANDGVDTWGLVTLAEAAAAKAAYEAGERVLIRPDCQYPLYFGQGEV